MEKVKLERDHHYTLNAFQADGIRLWESNRQDRTNLTLSDNGGNDILTVYNLTKDQLADLYLAIATELGESPRPTLHHLKKIHEEIGRLIQTVKPAEEDWTSCVERFGDDNT